MIVLKKMPVSQGTYEAYLTYFFRYLQPAFPKIQIKKQKVL
jgi:hypothetical protein